MALPPLTIRLFGPLRVTVCGAPLPRVRARSDEWLLALLVLRHGRAVSRSWLAGTLWPDSGESRALQNLRNALVSLRKALGPEGGRLQTPAPELLALDLAGAEVDLVRFDEGIEAGDERSLCEAVAVYTGPLLEGYVEEWMLAEREQRAERFLAALEALAEGVEARGEHAEAIGYLRRAEALDPLRDSITRRLMANLAAAGDPAAAIQVYRDFRNRLQAELAAVPEEATTRLFQEIRARGRERTRYDASGRAGERASGGTDALASPLRPEGTRLTSLARLVPSPAHPLTRSPAHVVPRPLTSLIGRDREVAEVLERLEQVRLVTLIGGGGVGKTRLALEVAARVGERYPGGAVWVDLAPLADSALVLWSVADALGIREEGVDGLAAVQDRLVAWIAACPPLLVLDNCEHVLDAVTELVQTFLQQCPELRVLATSRQRLGLTGERAWRVPPLPVPTPEETSGVPAQGFSAREPGALDPRPSRLAPQSSPLLKYPAIELFVERAATARPGFCLEGAEDAVAVGQICRRLDGIPLAIELAAARVSLLSVEQIAVRLDDRFRLLGKGSRAALPRHQTLRALIDWSYDYLEDAEAALLRRLSVFASGWTLEAAEAVCACDTLDLLDALVDRSLVLVEEVEGELRYRMLETVREYVRAKLRESGEEAAVRQQHREWALHLAEQLRKDLYGPRQEAALAQWEAELDNFRAVLEWCSSDGSGQEAHLRLVGALWPLWLLRGHLSEGREHLRRALRHAGDVSPRIRAQALMGAAALANEQWDYRLARADAEACLALFRALDDAQGIADALLCLGTAARIAHDAGARAYLEESLQICRRLGYAQGLVAVIALLGRDLMLSGQLMAARPLFEEGLTTARAMRDETSIAQSLYNLGALTRYEGDFARSLDLLRPSLETFQRLGRLQAVAAALEAIAPAEEAQGNIERALACHEECVAIWRRLGNPSKAAWSLLIMGNVAYRQGDLKLAHRHYSEGQQRSREAQHPTAVAFACNSLGTVAFDQGEPGRARELHGEALAIYCDVDERRGISWSLVRIGMAEAVAGDPEVAARLLGAASALREAQGVDPAAPAPRDLQRVLDTLRETLGMEAWETAWQEGGAMPLEQVIRIALGEEESPTPGRQSP